MHVKMTVEIKAGMNKMKYALNHQWKFARWRYAYLSGFAQVIITVLIAIISYAVIIFDNTVLDIVKDFVALEIVALLDTFFYQEYDGNREVCKMIVTNPDYHEILKVQTTTSRDSSSLNEIDGDETHPDRFVLDSATEWIQKIRSTRGKSKREYP